MNVYDSLSVIKLNCHILLMINIPSYLVSRSAITQCKLRLRLGLGDIKLLCYPRYIQYFSISSLNLHC